MRARFVIGAGAVALAFALPSAAAAETFVVDRLDEPTGALKSICTPAPADCSLEQAIDKANEDSDADLVSLGPGEHRTAGFMHLTEPMTIAGAGARQTIVRADDGPIFTIDNDSNLPFEVSDLTVTGAENEGPGYGGGFNISSPTTLRRVAILGNEDGAEELPFQKFPAWGGAIWVGSVPLNIIDSLIAGNIADAGSEGTNATGGGIFATGTTLLIRNSTITENVSRTSGQTPAVGGGITAEGKASITIENSTIAGNTASGLEVGRGSNIAAEGGSTVLMRNSVISDPRPPGGGNCLGAVTSGGGNVTDGSLSSCGFGGADRADASPQLGPLADNGGPTDTMALALGSPAIDFAGTCGLSTDQRGFPRLAGACDSGAFELQRPPAVAPKCSFAISGTVAKLEAKVTCDVSATVSIGGTATIAGKAAKKATTSKKKKKRPKPVTLLPTPGSTTLPGTPFKVTLNLPKRVRKAVKAGKRVSLDLTLTARTADGATSTTTAKVKKVRKPPRKKRGGKR